MRRIRMAAALGAAATLALLQPAAAIAGGKSGGSGKDGGSSSGSNGGGGSNSTGGSSANGGSGGDGSTSGVTVISGGADNALGGPSNLESDNGGVTLLGGPCVLTIGVSCLFQGNINLDNKLELVDQAYNGQTPAPPTLLHLTDLGAAVQDSGFTNLHAGTITSNFLVSYYAVKGGDDFRLYQVAPTYTFNWSTAGLTNGGGQEPSVSHVVWFDPPEGGGLSALTSAVPEPAGWALMIAGVGLTGAMLRRRRALSAA